MGTVVLSEVSELTTVKISELVEATSLSNTDVLPVVRDAVTKKINKINLSKDIPIDIEKVYHVAKNGSDSNTGTIGDPFLTIQAAIDCAYVAWNPIVSSSNRVIVKVAPGIYKEQIHSYTGLTIASWAHGYHPNHAHPATILYNTGADSAHYPFKSDESADWQDTMLIMAGITIRTATNGVFGIIPSGNFSNCRFEVGAFIERNSSCVAMFNTCHMYGCRNGGFDFTGTDLVGFRNLIFKDNCKISTSYGPVKLLSTHDGSGALNFQGDSLEIKTNLLIKGDWGLNIRICNVASSGDAARNIIDTTGSIVIQYATLLNGMHFVSNPAKFRMINSNFEGWHIPDGEADITADVAVTNAEYLNNIQHNGLSGQIQLTSPERNIGPCLYNKYIDLQAAVTSVPEDGQGIIRLWDDFTGLGKITLTHPNTNIQVDGQKRYSLTFTGDIIEIGANHKVSFANMAKIDGGNMRLNGAGSEIAFEDCQYVVGYLTLDVGAFAIAYKSSLFGSAGHAPINVNNVDTPMIIGYSRIQGSTGNPAVVFTVDADDKFKAKYSTFIHGDGGSNSPFVGESINDVIIAMYACGLNASFPPPNFTNSIGSPNNTVSAEITF